MVAMTNKTTTMVLDRPDGIRQSRRTRAGAATATQMSVLREAKALNHSSFRIHLHVTDVQILSRKTTLSQLDFALAHRIGGQALHAGTVCPQGREKFRTCS